jgi:hypothetical protein
MKSLVLFPRSLRERYQPGVSFTPVDRVRKHLSISGVSFTPVESARQHHV